MAYIEIADLQVLSIMNSHPAVSTIDYPKEKDSYSEIADEEIENKKEVIVKGMFGKPIVSREGKFYNGWTLWKA